MGEKKEKEGDKLQQREIRPSESSAGQKCITVDGWKNVCRCQYMQRFSNFFPVFNLFDTVNLIYSFSPFQESPKVEAPGVQYSRGQYLNDSLGDRSLLCH